MSPSPHRRRRWPAILLVFAACSSDNSSATSTTSEPVRAIEIAGNDGSDSWTLQRTPQPEGFCLTLAFDPPIRSPIVIGQAATAGPQQSKVAGADSCLGQELDADPQAATFEPVFAPFIYELPEFSRPGVAGALSSDAADLELELATGETRPASVREGGLFIEFPPEQVVALRITLEGVPWRCEISPAVGVGPCAPLGLTRAVLPGCNSSGGPSGQQGSFYASPLHHRSS